MKVLVFAFIISLSLQAFFDIDTFPEVPKLPVVDKIKMGIEHISSAFDRSHKTAVLTHFHRGSVEESLKTKLRSLSLSDMEIDDILDNSSHIITTYLQFIHHAKSKPVFLDFRSPRIEKKMIIQRTSAVLFPGGNMKLNLKYSNRNRTLNKMDNLDPGEYLTMIKDIMKLIRKENKKRPAMGRPQINLLGICLGFIGILFTDSKYRLKFLNVNRKYINDRISFESEHRKLISILRKNDQDRSLTNKSSVVAALFTARQKELLKTRKITFFNHQKSILVSQFKKVRKLRRKYNVVATYKVPEGKGVAIIESKTEPIYGTQFHPERMSFETHQNFSNQFTASERRINKQYSKLLNPDDESTKSAKEYVINTKKVRKTGHYFYIDVPDVGKYGMITVVSKKRNIERFAELIANQI